MQVEGIRDALQGAHAAPPPPKVKPASGYDPQEGVREVNERFVGAEAERQALIMQ